MKLRPVLIQAIAVVPLPMQLSKTISPSFVYVFMRYSNNATGFWVGCCPFTFAFLIVITLLGNLYPLFTTFTVFPENHIYAHFHCELLLVVFLYLYTVFPFPFADYRWSYHFQTLIYFQN